MLSRARQRHYDGYERHLPNGWCSGPAHNGRREKYSLSRIQQVIETLEAEQAELQERLAWLEKQLKEFHDHKDGGQAPVRSIRRATARRASTRRAVARTRRGDTKARIVEFLEKHPGSTAGEVARGLDLNRGSVSTRLTQLAKLGDISKSERGYSTK
jgi:hypothetical protein